jgi:phage baseplate assembly protein W
MSAVRRNPRAPWVLGSRRRLATGPPLEHLDDLVRLVLLTGPNERLHRPGFGAGLGASTLFEPLSSDLAGTVGARARGSLTDVLGDRLDVLEVTVAAVDSTLLARVVYRPKPAGDTRIVTLTLPAATL